MIKTYLCLPLVWLGLLLSATSQASVLTLPDQVALENIGTRLLLLEDVRGNLDISEVRAPSRDTLWKPVTETIPSYGYSKSVYWLYFAVQPEKQVNSRYQLEIAYPVLDDVQVYTFHDDTLVSHQVMGDRLPFRERPMEHANFIAPLDVAGEGITHVYLRVYTTSAVQLPISLYSSEKLFEAKNAESAGHSLYYGAMLVMTLYNLLIFASLRDISYFYCAMYIISMGLLMASIQGLTYMYLWPGNVRLNDAALVLSLSGMIFFPTLFFRSFLALPQTRPALSKILLVFTGLSFFTALGGFFLPYRFMIVTTMLIVLGAIAMGFISGILRWRDGYHAAKFFNIAWIFMFSAGILMMLNKFDVLPSNWFTRNVGQMGATLEVVLLSLALASRMNYAQRMSTLAQQETADAQRKLLDIQIRQNEELDRQVRQRTAELEEANAQLKHISDTDGLTQVFNRRAFEEAFEREYKRAHRQGTPLSVVMVDLDHFKQINDQHGHPFGDLCLVSTAHVITENIRRPPDIAARYGGEEFVILLPGTRLSGAVAVAEKIQKALASGTVRDHTHSVRLTASIGVACHIPSLVTERDRLLEEADQALYQAKHEGRNRVVRYVAEA